MADTKKIKVDETAVNKSMSRKKVIIIFALCSVLALIICMTSVLAVAFSLITEGTYEFDNERAESLTAIPADNDGMVDYLEKITGKAKNNIVTRFNRSIEISVDEGSFETDNSEADKAVLTYVKNKALPAVRECYPENTTGLFGENNSVDFPEVKLYNGDYNAATCYEGVTDEDGNVTDEDFYFLNIDVVGTDFASKRFSGVTETFNMIDSVNVFAELSKKTADDFKILSFKAEPLDFNIEAKSNRLTDEIQYLYMTENYKITATVEFLGSFSPLGTKTLSFDYKVINRYDYSWAGISFSDDIVTVEKGNEQSVSVNAVINNDSDYEIKFESSDTSVATIDEMGYVRGVEESNEPVTITATLSYLGETYTATCLVYVRKPVEKITVSDDKLALGVGDTAKLSAKLKPGDATDTDIIWISEDKQIATVSEDGMVTAHKKGTVSIIAVSDDGHFRDSCTVTVE